MKKLVSGILMVMALTIGVGSSIFAQNEQAPATPTDVVTVTDIIPTDAGLTPENPFYFLDRLGEFLRELFTFSPEAKVKLKIEFAKERISEIKIMLEDEEVDTDDVDEAQSLLVEDMEEAQDIVDEEEIDEDTRTTFEEMKNQLNDDQDEIDDEDEVDIEDSEDIEDNEQETDIEDQGDIEDSEDTQQQNERGDD